MMDQALNRYEAMAYLGIKSPTTFQKWIAATGCVGSPKNPGAVKSPRTWRIEELEEARKGVSGGRLVRMTSEPPPKKESPQELLDRLFPRQRRRKATT